MVALEVQGDRKKVEEIKSSNLAKKIIELGYKKTFADYENFTNYYVMFNKNITSQKDLDNIQIAFNRIQSDIKILYGAQYE